MNIFQKNYFLIIFICLSVSFILSTIIISPRVENNENQIIIKHGDSLWTLADKFGTNKQKESWINQVMHLNNLHTAHIKAGDVLTIPIDMEMRVDHSNELAGNSQ